MSPSVSRSRSILSVSILALAALAHVQVVAQPAACDGKMLAESQKLDFPYAVRPGGYCDGTVAFDNSAALQLVSYTMGPVRFAPQQPRMKLQSAVPAAGAPLEVVGVDKRPGGSYRFDAMLPASGIDLDLMPAIHPKGLKAEHLGFVAWNNRNGRPVYVPTVAGVPEAADAPLLVMRAPKAVVQAAYEICVEGQACGPQQAWAKDLEAGSRLELKLPKGPTARQAAVKITVLGPGGRVLGDVLQLLIP
jgi:hypothetical protein